MAEPGRRFALWIPLAALAAALLLALGGLAGVMRLEETDTFCGSCHTQPETTYLRRMEEARVSAAPVDSASSHQARRDASIPTRCIDCHAGPGLFGRVMATFEGAGNALRYATGTLSQPAKLHGWLPDANCLKCHTAAVEDKEFEGKDNHFHYFLARWRVASPAIASPCTECHLGHNDTVDPARQFLAVQKMQLICDRCHTTLARE